MSPPAGRSLTRGPVAAPGPPPAGLSEEEAAARAARGEANTAPPGGSRTLADILKANLWTRFNALLGGLLVVILVVGPPQDAVFGLLLVANAVIGITQELRAKFALERLSLLAAPEAAVVRGGALRRVPVSAVVLGDLVRAGRGDEVVVDGVLQPGPAVELDEALLTGESVPVSRSAGDAVLAGSFVSSGEAVYVATRVGEASYARRLTAEARRFQLVRSELMDGINRILRIVTWAIVPTALLLTATQLFANPSLADALRGAVAGVVTLVPEGLVLLTSASLALAVIRLGRRRVLVQQLPAVEMLARTDVVCMDKTGTLTEAAHVLGEVEGLPGAAGGWSEALAALARVERDPGPSLAAVAASHPAPEGWSVEAAVPFSSARKWSAARFAGRGWWVIGAPGLLLDAAAHPEVDRRARELGGIL